MNLADPELELIDPTPNVHALFLQFDKIFFWAKLTSRAVVRWSKRMYSCAGVCSYDRGGLCDIALSEPLLKLRPRKDLIETLLHEMIHAFLFITNRDQDRDGHGPNFKEHMYRINKAAGLNISIYHDFHDEVKLYQTHWWRCNGPCQTRKPYFGIVRRAANRAPGPSDCWWTTHKRNCGGTFVKIKEPEPKVKVTVKKNSKKNGDITKYVKNTNTNKKDDNRKPLTPIMKNVTNNKNGNTLLITKKTTTNSPISKPPSSQPPNVYTGKGQTVSGVRNRTNSVDVAEAVRNIWANKQLPGLSNSNLTAPKRKSMSNSNTNVKPNKHKIDTINSNSPPAKIKKIDDYFKTAATSILKDVYGKDFRLTQEDNKLVAVANKEINLVDCPICSIKIDSNKINRHLDECLNKDLVEKLSKDTIKTADKPVIEKISNVPFNNNDFEKMFKEENGNVKPVVVNEIVDLTNFGNLNPNQINNNKVFVKNEMSDKFDSNDVNRVKAIVKKINYDKHVRKSDNFVEVKEEPNNIDCGFLPSFLDDIGCAIKAPAVKIEPGTSKDLVSILNKQKCPCCGNVIDKPMAEHLDECLSFFDNNSTTPEEGASTSFANNTIVIDDDDDIFDETLSMNATGTKTPCPCCLEMFEMAEMNAHLDSCLK